MTPARAPFLAAVAASALASALALLPLAGQASVEPTSVRATSTRSPNALGQPTQVGSYASSISFHPSGAVAGYTLGNGVVHSLTLNERQLPKTLQDAPPSSNGCALATDRESPDE